MPGRGEMGKPRRRLMGVVKAVMRAVGLTKENAEDRRWKNIIRCGDSYRGSRKMISRCFNCIVLNIEFLVYGAAHLGMWKGRAGWKCFWE